MGLMSQAVMVTTPQLTKKLESTVLVKPKPSALLRIEKVLVKSPGVPEFQRLDVTGIVSPEEKGNGTTILVAGVPVKEEQDDTEIPTLQFTGFVHLETLLKKCSLSSQYTRPGTPRNICMESPTNTESLESDDMEVARSMCPFRERSIFRRSWREQLEAPANSKGLHILPTVPKNENKDMAFNKLTSEEENEVTIRPKKQHCQAMQGPFPLLPKHRKLQAHCRRSSPKYGEVRGQYLNIPEFEVKAKKPHF
nr:uncharacterized protein LOC110543807 [Meriones unguiculatus]